nr:alginate lyase family protein [uncultured Sediminibacterium sp.]
MGPRYLAYRALHLFRTKIGWYTLRFPTSAKDKTFISNLEWNKAKKEFYFSDLNKASFLPILTKEEKGQLSFVASRIRNGYIYFFNHKEIYLGQEYDWLTNPINGYKYPVNLHWSKVNDYDTQAGDIKFVWEKSRFSFLYPLIRDEQWNGIEHRDFIFTQILSWIDANPMNQGPNWKCSQEISIRVLNWIFALYYYSAKGTIDEAIWQKILNAISRQMDHVYKHINFSRIAVRNNHAITETLALYIVGLLFPWLDSSEKWKKNGKRWFENEIAYQVYPDGTYLQFSMNYHRVVVQLMTKAIVIAGVNGESFTDVIYERAYRSLNFLYQCQDLNSGMLPNYGANDGALFFPLNGCGYRDYRPQLNALHYALTGQHLHTTGAWLEDAAWLVDNSSYKHKGYEVLVQRNGLSKFDDGGYYLIRDNDTLTFLRAGSHKDRPSQADNLHLDIWRGSENVFIDGGSYKYNDPDQQLVNYFMGSRSHNTVMLDGFDQMLKGSRFIWFHWTQADNVQTSDMGNEYTIDATITAFRYLDKNGKHRRIIRKEKGKARWQVEDIVSMKSGHEMRQLWHLLDKNKDRVHLIPDSGQGQQIKTTSGKGWFSQFYGEKVECVELQFSSTGKHIKTDIIIKD